MKDLSVKTAGGARAGVVLMGCPGSGKGTLARQANQSLGLAAISTGSIIRAEIARATPLGMAVGEQMAAGSLLTDEIAFKLLESAFEQLGPGTGYMLDGFPRTLRQARQFSEGKHGPDLLGVVVLEADSQVVRERLAGRLVCALCGVSYHCIHKPPRMQSKCDYDQGALQRRPEDDAAVVEKRMDLYRRESEPIIAYYSELGIVRTFDSNGELDELPSRFVKAVQDLIGS